MVCVLDLGPCGEARAQACSVRSFGFGNKLPCIQTEIIFVFKDASGFYPLMLFSAVPGMFVNPKELLDLAVGGVIEILAPVGLVPFGFHGGSDSALQAW